MKQIDRNLKLIYFASMIIQLIVRIPYDQQRRKIAKMDQRVTNMERGLLAGLGVGTLAIPLIYSLAEWLDFANYGLPKGQKKAAGGLGLLIMTGALWLFWRSHHDLGQYWSPSLEIEEQHRLITHGIYSRIRHPMYASQWLWCLGQPLLLQNWIAGFSSLASFIPFYFLRVSAEERMMRDHFGDDYREYCQRTGRVLPK